MNSLPTMAETVGGVSATASPIANSSGSVTNQAIQVLQGPYITNTYGGGIQCQGPTMNVTPYVTGGVTFKKPFERYFDDPGSTFMMLTMMVRSTIQVRYYILCQQEQDRQIIIIYQ